MTSKENEVTFTLPNDSKRNETIHGTTHCKLQQHGCWCFLKVSKSANLSGSDTVPKYKSNKLTLNVGYSHPVETTAPEGVTFEVPANTQRLSLKASTKKLLVGSSANIRGVRPPEAFIKGKKDSLCW